MNEAADLFWHLQMRRAADRVIDRPLDVPRLWRVLLITAAPVLESAGQFQLHPRGDKAAKSAMRWIFAARDAHSVEGALDNPIIDLVAVSPDFLNVTSTFTGVADVLGCPTEPSPLDDPVRVFSTPLAWMRAGLRGVVLVGDQASQKFWLTRCEPGIIADSVPHGEALRIKMLRQVHMPKLLVAA